MSITEFKAASSCPTAIASWGDHLFFAERSGDVTGFNFRGKIDFSQKIIGGCTLLLVEDGYLIDGNQKVLHVFDATSLGFLFNCFPGRNFLTAKVCGEKLACVYRNGSIDLFHLPGGAQLPQIRIKGNIESFFIHQNETAITGHADGSIEFWNVKTWEHIKTLRSMFSGVKAVHCSGMTLFSRHGNKFCIWDLSTNTCLRTIEVDHLLQFSNTQMVTLKKDTVELLTFSTN